MTVPATVLDRAIELHERSLAAASQARWSEAEQAALESLKLIEAEDGLDSPDAANVCNLLSRIAEARTDQVDAERHVRRAWEIMEQLGSRCTGGRPAQFASRL